MSGVSHDDVIKVAQLATIPVPPQQLQQLVVDFDATLATVDNLKELDTSKVEPTSQVTGFENVWREDEIDEQRMLTQARALSGAAKTHQGYFVVPAILKDHDA